MTKVFKNSKHVLAFVLAFAVLAVSLFTGVVINSDAANDGYQVMPIADSEINAVPYNGKVTTVELLDSTKANSEANPYIITDPGQIFALNRDELTCDGAVVGKNHEYFKVADGIDAFYINGGETVANLETVTEVVNYFKDNPGSVWWSKYDAAFNGNFDGNGVTIYGLYSDGTSAGLFPYSSANSTTDAPQTIKNITVKNSYLTGSSAAGAIIGNFRGTAGSTIIENCASTNNYISSTNTSNMTGGALFGRGYGAVTVNNCLAYDNVVENSYVTTYNKNLLVGYSSGATYITNVIALGVTPWDLTAPWSRNHIDTGNFVNIFTDQDIQPLLDFATTQNTEANAIKYNINGNIKPADMLGANAAAKTAELTAANKAVRDANGWPFPGADLDWENTWICGANGEYPELRVFHDINITDNGNGTHSEACADCSLAGVAVAHTFDKEAADGKCTVCDADCAHKYVDGTVKVEGDCTTDRVVAQVCENCGHVGNDKVTTALGHDLKAAEEVKATCTAEGTEAHSKCSVCAKLFQGDTEVTAADLVIDKLAHTAKVDSNGIVYIMNAAEHSKTCSVCEQEFAVEPHEGDYTADDTGHTGTCAVCKMTTSGKEAHVFGDDNACDTCAWECTAHSFVDDKVKAEGDCTNDKVIATKCTICGVAGDDNVTAASGHTFEAVEEVIADCTDTGTAAHNHCTVCEKNFAADADIFSAEEKSDADLTLAVDPDVHRCEIIEAADATCTEDGNIKYSKCKKCSALFNSETGADLTAEDIVVEALGHNLTEVKEIAATTETTGTKAHYACSECDKLFADEKGTNEVKAEELVIAKLVVDDKEDDKTEDNKTETKPEGDKSDESPKTGETVAAVALAVTALVGAAFILARKARKA